MISLGDRLFRFPKRNKLLSIGSAQQYHGSSRNGTGVLSLRKRKPRQIRDSCGRARGAADMRKDFRAGQFQAIPALHKIRNCRAKASTRASSCFHGKMSAAESNGPTIARTSGNSSSREPAGISKRIAS